MVSTKAGWRLLAVDIGFVDPDKYGWRFLLDFDELADAKITRVIGA